MSLGFVILAAGLSPSGQRHHRGHQWLVGWADFYCIVRSGMVDVVVGGCHGRTDRRPARVHLEHIGRAITYHARGCWRLVP